MNKSHIFPDLVTRRVLPHCQVSIFLFFRALTPQGGSQDIKNPQGPIGGVFYFSRLSHYSVSNYPFYPLAGTSPLLHTPYYPLVWTTTTWKISFILSFHHSSATDRRMALTLPAGMSNIFTYSGAIPVLSL